MIHDPMPPVPSSSISAGGRVASAWDDVAAVLRDRLGPGSGVRRDELLGPKTTLRVGGPADVYVEPATEADLIAVRQVCTERGLPFFVLGRGSNLLIRDGGIRGVVVRLERGEFGRLDVVGPELHCGAGVRLKAVANAARANELAGMEFLEGIPGSVGGAVRMNAGAMKSWTFEVLARIRYLDPAGGVHERPASEIPSQYRGCPLFRDHVAMAAVFTGRPDSGSAIRERMEAYSRRRWDSQPAQPSAGCVFKNPESVAAGRLIDQLGLKGLAVGAAVVSDVHGNFIVNAGGASARDVLTLMEVIRDRVRTAVAIELHPEVEIVGED